MEGVIDSAKRDGGKPITVGVVGVDGFLLALERMNGAPPVGVNVVINKAHTAVVGRKDTIDRANTPARLAEREGQVLNSSDFGDPLFTILGGGVVIWAKVDGVLQPVGGIAVSGRKSQEDHDLAAAHRDEFQKLLRDPFESIPYEPAGGGGGGPPRKTLVGGVSGHSDR